MVKEWTVGDWYSKIEARRRAREIQKREELEQFLNEAKHSQSKKKRLNRRPPRGFAEARKSESLLSYGD